MAGRAFFLYALITYGDIHLFDALARDLGLATRPGLRRDSAFPVLSACGLAVCAGIWIGLGVDPRPSVPSGGAAWMGGLLLQPAIEELLFRGLLQGELLRRFGARGIRFRDHFGGLTLANLATSLAFTGAHFVHHAPLWALATLPPSLALGWMRERTDSTWSALALHMVWNLELFATAALFAR